MRKTVVVGGVTVGYRDAGEPGGAPVVLLHGGSSSAATWDRLTGRLRGRGLRTIAVDLRGHGDSSRTPTYPLTGYRDDVLGLLDRLGLERVALVGHSLGAYTALLVAQQAPERVVRLVLEEPPMPTREAAEAHGLNRARFLLPAIGILATRRRADAKAVIAAVRQLREPDPQWWTRLERITAPTLVISGGPGSHIAPERLRQLVAALPDAAFATVPVGHRIHRRAPAPFEELVIPFLSDVR
ncbi:alpha/beta hydrolase [Actinoplanes sp. NPDC051851]|uniref:alpha/beta fold hydrolase n=1 Tax=Actinoplanes sp. NPDC051851 TaxID=3154753 RepID=UPI003448C196